MCARVKGIMTQKRPCPARKASLSTLFVYVCEMEEFMTLKEILLQAYERHASDIHIMTGSPVMFRVNGTLAAYREEPVIASDMEEILNVFLNKAQRNTLDAKGEFDTAVTIAGFSRLRVSLYRQSGEYGAAVHMLSLEIPTPDELELPMAAQKLTEAGKGLILVTGEAGSGKTTTVASLLDKIAKTQAKHIVTVENPIEYLLPRGIGMASQREIGSDTKSYADAIRAAMRQDADVIYISEISDPDTALAALAAAEAGHLVIASLYTGRAEDTLKRLSDLFPEQRRRQAYAQLSGVLRGIVAQQLLPQRDGDSQSAVFEIMLVDKEMQALLLEGRFSAVSSAMEKKREAGMQTMDDAILEAYMKSRILAQTARQYATDKERMRQRMQIY